MNKIVYEVAFLQIEIWGNSQSISWQCIEKPKVEEEHEKTQILIFLLVLAN